LQPPASASDACPRLGKRREATWVDPTTSSLSPSFSANNRVYVEERDPAAVPNSPAARSLRSQHRTPPSPPRPWWASAPRCRRARFQFDAVRSSPTSPPGGRRSSLRRCGQGRTSVVVQIRPAPTPDAGDNRASPPLLSAAVAVPALAPTARPPGVGRLLPPVAPLVASSSQGRGCLAPP
jgi:hypothetical protein